MRAQPYLPIGDYVLIGDCHGSALVARDGSIDWCCLGRFDAAPALWRLLDAEKGATFEIGLMRGKAVERGLNAPGWLIRIVEGWEGRKLHH